MLSTSDSSLIVFIVSSLLLAVTPGPGVFYIVTRSISQGRRAGLASVAGVALGNLGNSVGAAVGLAALFAISALAFQVVKFAGAAYLVYLGIKTLIQRSTPTSAAALGSSQPARIFRDGFVVALLNPKTALFFSAFLPQFMNPHASALLQSLAFGATFVAIAACTDTLYALAASAIGPAMSRLQTGSVVGRYLTGSALIGLGLFTAFNDNSRGPA
jgi:threonine/homoserine/homoserine lactone efflux protein